MIVRWLTSVVLDRQHIVLLLLVDIKLTLVNIDVLLLLNYTCVVTTRHLEAVVHDTLIDIPRILGLVQGASVNSTVVVVLCVVVNVGHLIASLNRRL